MNHFNFATIDQVESELARELHSKILECIKKYGDVRILLSGGSTPVGLYSLLAKEDIPWSKMIIGLCDERFVPIQSEYSNERLIREVLLVQDQGLCRFVGMVYDEDSYANNLITSSEKYKIFEQRLDIVLLGMGGDGHTASLFPSDPASDRALDAGNTEILANTNAPTEPKNRISCTLNLLTKAHKTYLLLKGESKMKTFQEAGAKNYPINAFLTHHRVDLQIYSTTNNES